VGIASRAALFSREVASMIETVLAIAGGLAGQTLPVGSEDRRENE
jgi:hypothetical protein